MPTSKVTRNRQVTIPKSVCEIFNIEEGSIINFEIKNKKIVMIPQELINKEHKWFWTKEWQKGEKQAEDDIKKGRISGPFKNAKDLINHLRRKKKQ